MSKFSVLGFKASLESFFEDILVHIYVAYKKNYMLFNILAILFSWAGISVFARGTNGSPSISFEKQLYPFGSNCFSREVRNRMSKETYSHVIS